jgi:hypothetical protein
MPKLLRKISLIIVAAVPTRAGAPEPAAPSEPSMSEKAELKAQYDKLFAELLQRPTDLDLMGCERKPVFRPRPQLLRVAEQ